MLSQNGVSLQPLEVKDFSGGITDDFIGAPSNKYKRADNFYSIKVGAWSRLITRPGLSVYDTANARTPTTFETNDLFDVNNQLFQIVNKRVYYNNSGFTHVTGPTGNEAFNAGDTNSNYSITRWNDQAIIVNDAYSAPVKVFKDGATWNVHSLGLPAMTGSPTYGGAPAANTRFYAFNYTYQYTNNGITYEEDGPVYFYGTAYTGNFPNLLTFPASFTVVNTGGLNYDLTNIKFNIYRTQNNGDVFYKIGQVAHNAVSFNDTFADASIVTNEVMPYFIDSPLTEAPPLCKFIHQANGSLIAANIKVGSQAYPSKFRITAKPFIWAMPEDFEEDCEEEIKGISSFGQNHIIFCEKKVLRIEGEYFIDGSGSLNKRVISSTAGCLSNNSIVKTDIGLFWWGNDGIYFTDGYAIERVTDHLNFTYKNLTETTNQKAFLHGVYDSKKQIVVWSTLTNSVNTENDSCFVLHLRYGVSKEMPCTTWSGGENFRPTCLYYFNNTILLSDYRGYLLQFDDDYFSDIKVNTLTSASTWGTIAITYDHITSAFDFGTSSYRKWIPSLSVNADNASSISLEISSNNDNSEDYRELSVVTYKGKEAWGDDLAIWGDVNARWNYFPIIGFKRRFPSGALRCTYKQLRFTNAYSDIDDSTIPGTATFNGAANTATLGSDWADGISDYYISTSNDNYTNEYKILSQSGVTLTLEDTFNTLPTGTFHWKIKGTRKNEILKIISYTLYYGHTASNFEVFKGET